MIIQLSESRGIEILQSFSTEEELIRRALVKASGNIWHDRSPDALTLWQEVGIEDAGEMAQADRYTEKFQPTLANEYLFVEKRRFERALGGLFTVCTMIKDLPGRKSVLLISDGFPDLSSKTLESIVYQEAYGQNEKSTDYYLNIRSDTGRMRIFDPFNILDLNKVLSGEEVLRELIRFANAQNISIYALDPDMFIKYLIQTSAEYGPKDVISQPMELRAKDKISRVQNLRWLSEDTGGVSLRGATKYERFYEVMSSDLNYYYQLSYYPPRKEPDNSYHRIGVKVKRPGVDIRSRKGYTDYSDKKEEKMSLVSAFYNPALFKELPFKAEFVFFHRDSTKFEPWINIALPAKELFLERKVEFGQKNFDLYVWVKDTQKGERAFGGQITLPFTIDDSFMDFIKTTDYLCLHYKGRAIPVSQKEYQTIFALYDEDTDELGTWEAMISLPDLKNKKQGELINCVLGFTAANPKKGKNFFSLSQEDGSLVFGEMKFYPAVVNQFQRMQNASVFLQVYLPLGKSKVEPEFKVSGEGRIAQEIHGQLVAEDWNGKSKVWSGIFALDLSTVIFGQYSLHLEISVTEGSPPLTKDLNLIKLRY